MRSTIIYYSATWEENNASAKIYYSATREKKNAISYNLLQCN